MAGGAGVNLKSKRAASRASYPLRAIAIRSPDTTSADEAKRSGAGRSKVATRRPSYASRATKEAPSSGTTSRISPSIGPIPQAGQQVKPKVTSMGAAKE